MKPVIEVNNISKSYQISHQEKASYDTIKDDFAKIFKKPFGGGAQAEQETFWALKDINFEVNPGEIFGVIGKNGSGKSTLLKILSRIVDPTSGDIKIHGKVASLLEVGTGFHPELTGRENIYFNGSMIGMSKQEITKKFDEIVAFSEVEKFLDTPVKFYSSGMFVRLAFSVAAHLDSQILILDEVLSVGDAGFQQKSLRKILSTMEEGRTVLFVSHSMGAVRQLCNRGLLLKNGRINLMGDVEDLISRYMEVMEEEAPDLAQTVWENNGKTTNKYFVPNKIYATGPDGKIIKKSLPNDQDHYITIEADVKQESDLLTIGIAIYNEANGSLMLMSYPTDKPQSDWQKLKKGKVILRSKLPAHLLNAGGYKASLIGGIHNEFWIFEPGTKIPSIQLNINGGLSESPYWKLPREGLLAPILDWEIENK